MNTRKKVARINIKGRIKTIAALLAVVAAITGMAAATAHASAIARKSEFLTVAPHSSIVVFYYRRLGGVKFGNNRNKMHELRERTVHPGRVHQRKVILYSGVYG